MVPANISLHSCPSLSLFHPPSLSSVHERERVLLRLRACARTLCIVKISAWKNKSCVCAPSSNSCVRLEARHKEEEQQEKEVEEEKEKEKDEEEVVVVVEKEVEK